MSISNDALFVVLSFLRPEEIARCASVSGQWKRVSSSDILWRQPCRELGASTLRPPFGWKRAFELFQSDKIEDQKQKEKLMARTYAGYACGMRATPMRPRRVAVNADESDLVTFGGFHKHPDQETGLVFPYSIDLARAVQEYVDFEQSLVGLGVSYSSVDYCNEEFIDVAIYRYFCFLELQNKHAKTMLVPPKDVEVVWRSHLIRTIQYKEDCERLFGRVIPHRSLVNEFEYALRPEMIRATEKLWTDAYNVPYSRGRLPQRLRRVRYTRGPFTPLTDIRNWSLHFDYMVEVDNRSQHLWPHFVQAHVDARGDWTNPFSFNAKDVIEDREWVGMWNEFCEWSSDEMRKSRSFGWAAHRQIQSGVNSPALPTKRPPRSYGESRARASRFYPRTDKTADFFRQCAKSYERFLFVVARTLHESGTIPVLHPPVTIDAAWHAHMINTDAYAHDTEVAVGTTPSHDPWPDGKECEADMNENSDWLSTQWQRVFGDEQNIWFDHWLSRYVADNNSRRRPSGPLPNILSPFS